MGEKIFDHSEWVNGMIKCRKDYLHKWILLGLMYPKIINMHTNIQKAFRNEIGNRTMAMPLKKNITHKTHTMFRFEPY